MSRTTWSIGCFCAGLTVAGIAMAQQDLDLDALLNELDALSEQQPETFEGPARPEPGSSALSPAPASRPTGEPAPAADEEIDRLIDDLLGVPEEEGIDAAPAVAPEPVPAEAAPAPSVWPAGKDMETPGRAVPEPAAASLAESSVDDRPAADPPPAPTGDELPDRPMIEPDDGLSPAPDRPHAPATGSAEVAVEEDGSGTADTVRQAARHEPSAAEPVPPAPGDEPPVVPEPAEAEGLRRSAEELAAATIVRLRAREKEGLDRLREGSEAMVRQDFELARELFAEALRLIPERPDTMHEIQSAREGHVDADLELAQLRLKQQDVRGAQSALESAFRFDPANRRARRLQRQLDRIGPEGEEPYRAVADRPETQERNEAIENLLLEGRDFFEYGQYDEAAERFEQVRLLDEYNRVALWFLRRIADRKYRIEDLTRRQTIADRMAEVRGRWNPPLKTDVERPVLDSEKGVIPVDRDPSEVVEKMKSIIIPSIEFRNANIIDVVDELRRESERVDKKGVGVNIVLKLAGAGAPTPLSSAAPPAGDEGSTSGGRDDFGFFDAPAGGGFEADFGDFEEGSASDAAAAESFLLDETHVPRITLTLRRISLYDALKIITEYADLKFKIDRGIVFITPRSAVVEPLETRVYAVQPSLLDVVVESEKTQGVNRGDFIEMGREVQVRRVDVKDFFSRAGVPFPEGTSITYNAANSQLIVRNTLENLEIFERILPNFNIPPTQVEIEARFVEILQEDLEELGIEWILTDDYEIARNPESSPIPALQERLQFDANNLTRGLRFLNAGPAGVEAASRGDVEEPNFFGDVISFSSVLTNPELNVILHALSQRGGMDLLSAPRITTRSGVAATIEVVEEIIYPTEFEAESATSRFDVDISDEASSDLNLATSIVIFPESFETREVGVILNVTPTVGPDKYTIDLSLAPEVAELVDWIQYGTPPFNIPQPIFASRNATTSIVIWDGQTVVMGGLINETMLRFEDKIPFLGDVPFVGRFFRSEGERSVKRNLLIFVTARIVDPSGNPVNQAKAVAEATLPNGAPGLNGASP